MFTNSSRGMGLGTGVILVILGAILFAFPALSMSVFAIIVGFGIMLMGASSIIMWARNLRGTGSGGAVLATGILSLLFGFLCILEPLVFAEAMTWIVAILVIFFGVSQIGTLISMKGAPGRGIGIIGSLCVVLFGIFAFIWPTFLMQFIGLSLFIEGLTVIIMSMTSPTLQAH